MKRPMTHSLGTATAFVGLLALAAMVTGCGHGGGQDDPAQAEASVSSQFQLVDGTLLENQAAQLLARRDQQEAVRVCMRERGQHYQPDLLDGPVWSAETFRVGHGGMDWLEPLYPDLNIGDWMLRAAAPDKDIKTFDGWTDSQRRAYDAALDSCAHAGDSAFQLFPDQHETLAASLSSVLLTFDREASKRADEYSTCMAAEGFDVSSPNGLFEVVASGYPRGETPRSVDSATEPWQAAYQRELDGAQADTTCRQNIYLDGMTAAAPAVAAWADEHASDLAELSQQWQEMVDRAMQYPEAETVLGSGVTQE